MTIPYFDPALPFEQRQKISQLRYGFKCSCDACVWARKIGRVSQPEDHLSLAKSLQSFLSSKSSKSALSHLPLSLRPILHESFLPSLSLKFSSASHDGPFIDALIIGEALFALYTILYPTGYPMIGEFI